MDRVPASARKGWWTFREVADAGNVAAVPGRRKGSVGVTGNDNVEEEGKGAGALPPPGPWKLLKAFGSESYDPIYILGSLTCLSVRRRVGLGGTREWVRPKLI